MLAHPLQSALDRATTATYTVVDLIDIARSRKPSGSGREGRPDARQESLYRAVIASTIAAVEETFEALTVAALASLGTPALALNRLTTAIGKAMQSPGPQNLDNLLNDYVDFTPSEHWRAHLAFSSPAYRRSDLADKTLDYRLIYTAYAGFREFAEDEASDVLGRFVKIRNSFAHQDVSTLIFLKSQQAMLRNLRTRKAASADERLFVEAISATCAVTLDAHSSGMTDPVVRWTIHETHAVNALLMYIGLVISTTDALALHLESTAGVAISKYDKLVLRVQDGRWWDWNHGHTFASTNVGFELTPYRPGSRSA
ncbi:hypothetical protein GCM10010910_24240 [Microbacterium nanhaiense]|uniref:Apea-like HEPN domain-containing protein n=1 Tax=Microbacterium nanhaiense TaxID=1301026 RepID=A0ABQ2N7H2_9MICO|nr:hypothetical protein [Microbacterium nanhaiense]GGO65935.1 hypothetical protein GCM10010910_24240 [Microbacterium nanhaiense]